MGSSRLRATFSRFQKPKALWPDPERSIGKLLGTKKEKFNIWEAKGPAKEVFESIRPHITELLEYSCGPVPSSSFVLFDIFMIGEQRQAALPHIMFSCKHREPRKAAVAAMRKSNILEKCLPGIYLGDWDYPPHVQDSVNWDYPPNFKDLQYLASAACHEGSEVDVSQQNESTSSPYDENFTMVHDPCKEDMAQALQIVLQNTSTEIRCPRTATIGSIVMLSGRRFYLAPAHVYVPQSHVSPDMVPESSRSEDSECEFGGFEDGDGGMSDSAEVEFMSQYSVTPESSDLEEDWDFDEDDSTSDVESDCLNSEVQAKRPNGSLVTSGDGTCYVPKDANIPSLLNPPYPEVKLPFLKSDNLDYCLIEVDENEHEKTGLPVLSLENIGQLNSESVDVVATTGSGNIITGVLSSRISCIRLPNGTRFVDFLSVRFEDSLQPGDSGSIVRDARTGLIYGHIVAGDIGSQSAVVIPAIDVLNDMMAKSRLAEIPSAEQNHEIFMHHMGLEKTSNDNGEMYIHASQISDRAEIRSNPNTKNTETMRQTSSYVGLACEAKPEVDLKVNSLFTVKYLHQQRPNTKDEEWKTNRFSERLESQSDRDTSFDIGIIEPDKTDPTSTSSSIIPTRRGYRNQALIQDYTIGCICAIPTEYVAAKAFLDEEQDGPVFNVSCQARKRINPSQGMDTCRWSFNRSEIQSWLSDPGDALWVSGKPGSGKCMFSRSLLDDALWPSAKPGSGKCVFSRSLPGGRPVSNGSATIPFFFKSNEENSDTGTAIHAPLHLISRAEKGNSRNYTENTAKKCGERLKIEYISSWKMWTSETYSSSTGDVIWLLDALDECQKPKRDRMVQELKQFSKFLPERVEVGSNLKFLGNSLTQDIEGYFLGQIGKNIMIISVLLVRGNGASSATKMMKYMTQRSPTIQIVFMVYIGSCGPSSNPGIHLGDVVFSGLYEDRTIILRHDFGKTIPQQVVQESNFINLKIIIYNFLFGSHNSGFQIGMNNGSINGLRPNAIWQGYWAIANPHLQSRVQITNLYLPGDGAGIASSST